MELDWVLFDADGVIQGARQGWMEELSAYTEVVYRRVVEEGPLVAGDLKARVGKKGTWWDYDDGKRAWSPRRHDPRCIS